MTTRTDFVRIAGDRFEVSGRPVTLRGWTLGSWMNLEHFMMGLPGTHWMIREAFAEVYGAARADCFFRALAEAMAGEEDFAYLKALGTNAVRIPFSYHWFLDDQAPDVFREEGFEMLERAVALCRKHGLYAILDLHSAPGAQNNDWHADSTTGQALFWRFARFREDTCRLWREIARRYADDPWVAGYDVLNEPTYGLTRELFNGFYRQVTAAVREADANHILFLEGDDFGRSFDLFDEPEDPQTTYAVHYYPFVLEEDVLDPAMPKARREAIFREIFDRQLSVERRFRRPIWCGESGYNIPDGQEEFYRDLLLMNIGLCEEHRLSWSLWTYKDARRMGIVIPRADSPWMRLRARLEQRWTHEWEQRTSMEITRSLWDRYGLPVNERLAYDLDFRVRSVLHRLEVEELLKPVLRTIPYEELMTLPASFAFANCDRRQIVIDGVEQALRCGSR